MAVATLTPAPARAERPRAQVAGIGRRLRPRGHTCARFNRGPCRGRPPRVSLPPRLNETLHHFMASMPVTKGVISTNPLGMAGRATCRPFGDGLVSTHPIPFGNISLTAKTERNTSPFHGLHDGDKGGWFQPTPFCVAGRAMVVSRFTSLHDDDKGGRITRPPLSWSGRATCRTLWRWGHFNWPHPLRQPQSYRQD